MPVIHRRQVSLNVMLLPGHSPFRKTSLTEFVMPFTNFSLPGSLTGIVESGKPFIFSDVESLPLGVLIGRKSPEFADQPFNKSTMSSVQQIS